MTRMNKCARKARTNIKVAKTTAIRLIRIMVSPPGEKVKLSESPNGTLLAVTGRETHAMNITDEIPNPTAIGIRLGWAFIGRTGMCSIAQTRFYIQSSLGKNT
jgi:hypothetical protein